MRNRLRGFLKGALGLFLAVLVLAALFVGWRAFLRYGPGSGPPVMFQFHAKALLRWRAGFPMPAPEVVVPVPRSMSSADVQLRLMKWWDGKTWLPEALAHGESGRTGLRLRAGSLAVAGITGVEPTEPRDGKPACRVRFRLRWDVPQDLQEIFRVRDIVDLRLPKGAAPGQTLDASCTFVLQGWRWEPVSADLPRSGTSEARPRTWADRLI